MTREEIERMVEEASVDVIDVTRYQFTFPSSMMFANVRTIDVIGGEIHGVSCVGLSQQVIDAMRTRVHRMREAADDDRKTATTWRQERDEAVQFVEALVGCFEDWDVNLEMLRELSERADKFLDKLDAHKEVAEARAIRESIERMRGAGWTMEHIQVEPEGDYAGGYSGWVFVFTEPGGGEVVIADGDGSVLYHDDDVVCEWAIRLVQHFGDRPDVLVKLLGGKE